MLVKNKQHQTLKKKKNIYTKKPRLLFFFFTANLDPNSWCKYCPAARSQDVYSGTQGQRRALTFNQIASAAVRKMECCSLAVNSTLGSLWLTGL